MMDDPALDRLKANEWDVVHTAGEWQPRLDEMPFTQAVNSSIDLGI
jgi:hypothetical protein